MKKQTPLNLGWSEVECIFSKVIKTSLSCRKRAMRRTACSCGRSSAATTMMTCQCLRPCSWRKVRLHRAQSSPTLQDSSMTCSTRDGASQSTAAGAQETVRTRQQQLLPRSGPETQLPAGRPQVKPPPTPTGSPLYWRGSEVYLFPALCAIRKRGVDSDWIWLCDWLMAGWCHNTRCYGTWTGERDWDLEERKYETHNLPLPSRSRFLLWLLAQSHFIAHYQVKSGPKHLRTFKIWLCWKVFRFCISTHLFTYSNSPILLKMVTSAW